MCVGARVCVVPGVLTALLCLCAADIMVVGVRNPFEVVKQQMQVGMHTSARQAVRDIVKADGVAGLYAGYFSTLLREIPFDALQFVLYEGMKAKFKQWRQKEELAMWETSLVGSCAGATSAGITTPLDVVKTRLMTQTGVAASERYAGVWDAMRTIAQKEGLPALFSGARQRIAWIGLGGAIFFGTFEQLKAVCEPLV